MTLDEIRDTLEWGGLSGDLAGCEVALARLVGPRSGEYVELDWLKPPGWPWTLRAVRAPRIFATPTPHDREAEGEARDLLHLFRRADRLGPLDEDRRRAVAAADLALRAMRSRERVVLLFRLDGKRGAPDTIWSNVATESDLESVPLAKEVFKVAVREFLAEFGRVTALLLKDPDYVK